MDCDNHEFPEGSMTCKKCNWPFMPRFKDGGVVKVVSTPESGSGIFAELYRRGLEDKKIESVPFRDNRAAELYVQLNDVIHKPEFHGMSFAQIVGIITKLQFDFTKMWDESNG